MTAERWSSRVGFLLAAVGAAVGLGNIWRFSAVVGQNGGGAYLLPYLVAAVVCAVPLLVLELAVGRTLRTDVVSAFRTVGDRYAVVGWAVVAGVLLILSYYLVLTGWVLGFLVSWSVGSGTTFAAFTAGWRPVAFFVVATALTGGVVSLGVRDGIERLATYLLPTVFVLLAALAAYATTLPGWGRAVAFLFTPDFSVLSDPGLWSAAVGQVFFSLSVGQGIMLTYGSYVDDDTDLTRSAFAITVVDVGAAITAGLVIFPVVFSFGLRPTLGTELAFTTLPTAFATMPFGRPVAVAFFGLLALAALSSAVAMLEVGVAALTATGYGRRRATWLLTGVMLLAGAPSALSYSPANLALAGVPVLDIVDATVGTFALPVSAVLIVAVFVFVADLDAVRAELGAFVALVRYVVPVVLVAVVVAKVAGVARPAWRLLLDEIGTLATVVLVPAVALTAVQRLLPSARQPVAMTDLRYLPDADDVTEFEAAVTEATEEYVVLDGTYFYPEGGGQPADRGRLSWDGGEATVRDVRKNHGDVRHYVESIEGTVPAAGTTVTGEIDADRRERLRRMHTAQHVVSRVVLDEFDAATAGNQIHVDRSRIDFEPADFDAEDVATIERAANRVVDADLPVSKAERPRADVEAETPEGRTQLDLIPDHVDPLRVVEIAEFDTCPCGGTHVDRTGELGAIRVTDRASKGADVERIEFELDG
nr:sodium-dependent transporter [Halomicroarcula sp. S1AR25-4]